MTKYMNHLVVFHVLLLVLRFLMSIHLLYVNEHNENEDFFEI